MPKKKRAQRQPPLPADAPLNAPDVPVEDKQRQLEGRRPEDQQSAVLDVSEIETLEEFTDLDQYEGEIEAGSGDVMLEGDERLDMLTEQELRAGETDDAFKAAEEGLTYVPPMDPPIVPSDDPQSVEVASGMGVSALDEPYDEDHRSSTFAGGDTVQALIYDALRADSSTTGYADRIAIIVRGNTVILRGLVDDLDDSDNLVAVAQYVEGVAEVVDELRIKGM